MKLTLTIVISTLPLATHLVAPDHTASEAIATHHAAKASSAVVLQTPATLIDPSNLLKMALVGVLRSSDNQPDTDASG